VYDGLGSVVGEVAPDGTLTRSQSFDVYGCVRTSSGTATTKHKFVGALGHPSDDETGLIYMRARHYDPVCGRFVSEDPAGTGSNWFLYCADNPVCAVDRDGRSAEFLSALGGFFIGLWFGFCVAFGEFFVKRDTPESLNVFWLFAQSVGGAALAYYGELTNLGALSALAKAGQVWRIVRAVGVTGFSVGAIGAAVQILYGYHAGQIGFALALCEYDMENS
jgi:RHS repeat-associated protein